MPNLLNEGNIFFLVHSRVHHGIYEALPCYLESPGHVNNLRCFWPHSHFCQQVGHFLQCLFFLFLLLKGMACSQK